MSRAPRPHGAAPRSSTASQSATGVLGHDQQLDALLTRVAGAVDHALDPVDLALGKGERRRLGQAEPLERAGSLHGQQRVLDRHVANVRARKLVLLQPVEVGIACSTR